MNAVKLMSPFDVQLSEGDVAALHGERANARTGERMAKRLGI
jgi:hypothetical protein